MAETAAYALGPPPTWARDGSSASSSLDGADMLEEGWSYLRRLFTICFEVTEGESLHVGVEEVGLLLRTIELLKEAGHEEELHCRIRAQCKEAFQRSAAGLDRRSAGAELRSKVLERWVQLRAWSRLWMRLFEFLWRSGSAESALTTFADAVTARLQPSGLAHAGLLLDLGCDEAGRLRLDNLRRLLHELRSRDRAALLDEVRARGREAFGDIVQATGDKPAHGVLFLVALEVAAVMAREKLKQRLARWRRLAPLVGRWRRFLLLLFDEVHYRPGMAGQKRCREEFEALAQRESKRTATDSPKTF
jgi:hypothetical protein